MAELSQTQLEEMVNGRPAKPNAEFYEQAVLDREKSVAAGRRVYEKVVYIRLKAPGVTDWVAYRAQPADIRQYPEAYERYLNSQQGMKEPGVDIIPGLDILHLQELRDIGLGTIPKLAEAEVPPHLEYAKRSAVQLNQVLKEQKHEQEKNQQEVSTEKVFTKRGPDDLTDVGRYAVHPSQRGEGSQVAEGIRPGGRDHGSQSLTQFGSWSVTL